MTNADNKRIRVGVIFGGRSGEHEVSLRSARSVMDSIDKEKYEVLPIGITKEGHWVAGGDPWQQLADGRSADNNHAALLGEPGDPTIKAMETTGSGEAGLRAIATLDVIFPMLHGTNGEDGTIQGLLELADIAYVGAGVTGSAVGMDKAIFKAVMVGHGIPILPYELVLRTAWETDPEAVLNALEEGFTYPIFVKPANLGSSVGVGRATTREELRAALDNAARYDRRLVVEQGIDAREIEVAVLGNEHPIASVPGEIVPGDSFYSYEDKYIKEVAEPVIPAPLDEETTARIRKIAVEAYQAIDAAGMARVDFLLDKATGALYMNEINTLPGFTSISMYPKLWKATGMTYTEIIDRLIQLALERHAQKGQSTTSYDGS